MAEKNIQSVLHEARVFPPPRHFSERAAPNAAELKRLYDAAAKDYVGFWADLAVAEMVWHRPFSVPLDDSDAPNYRWFTDGELNVSYNCLDVHLAANATRSRSCSKASPGTCAS